MTENNLPPTDENKIAIEPPVTTPAEPTSPALSGKLLKQLIVIGSTLLLAVIGLIFIFIKQNAASQPAAPPRVTYNNMMLTSPAFKHNDYLPAKFTCDGTDTNPPLVFGGVPKETVSLVLVVDDPDSPSGEFTHWLIWNIDPKATGIEENSVPAGAMQGHTDFGVNKYGGPCPHQGVHRYRFALYALNTALDLPASTDKKILLSAIQNYILAETKLIGVYSR
ncbi:MAG: YbhB/YbcL family Raf kinase inhibitor-like protein [Patescibacteria group bacterium]|nr:YbhB/YbcL family Raf kinase inhibitor-like protein [Patescibacteria group bacterium]